MEAHLPGVLALAAPGSAMLGVGPSDAGLSGVVGSGVVGVALPDPSRRDALFTACAAEVAVRVLLRAGCPSGDGQAHGGSGRGGHPASAALPVAASPALSPSDAATCALKVLEATQIDELDGAAPLRALAAAEARLGAARAPRHRAAALRSVDATLALLGPRAASLPALRAVVALLTRAARLDGGSLAADCARLLGGAVAAAQAQTVQAAS